MYPFNKVLPFKGKLNPQHDSGYQEALELLPVTQERVKSIIHAQAEKVSSSDFSWEILPDNSGIMPENILEDYKKRLITSLNKQLVLAEWKKPIIIIRDSCFTNNLLEKCLRGVLGEDSYDAYVDTIEINYETETEDVTIYEKIHNNAIIILWGSFSDTYAIKNRSFYRGKLASIIRDNLSELPPEGVNQRILWICFGQQLLASILWAMHKETPQVIVNSKWAAQFGWYKCTIENLEYVPPVFRHAMEGLSDVWTNTDFSAAFTRTGHVNFNLFGNGKSPVMPLARDIATWDIVAWGFNRVLWFQGHPEIRFQEDESFLVKFMSDSSPGLERDYGNEVESIVNNFRVNPELPPIKDIDSAFYVPVLLALSNDIVETHNKREDNKKLSPVYEKGEYKELNETLLNCIHVRSEIIRVEAKGGDPIRFNEDSRMNILANYDVGKEILDLNTKLDWQVNRGNYQVSMVLWFKNLAVLTEDIVSYFKSQGNHGPYVFRDWGAGNGTLIKELYKLLPKRDIIFYGVGDTVYFDLYQGLKEKQKEYYPGIPDEVLILFTMKVIEWYNKLEKTCVEERYPIKSGKLFSKIFHILQGVQISPDDIISRASMFSESTTMFSRGHEQQLSEKTKEYIRSNKEEIRSLKMKLMTSFYSFFEGYFERIYISSFSHFSLENRILREADIQVAIRSTSHIDDEAYFKVIADYLLYNSRSGSIFLDNGVHRSYSSVPRLAELYKISKRFPDVTINLVYDRETNYFCTAIIQKQSNIPLKFFRSHIREWHILISIEDAVSSTFFKLEAFLRNFIVANFKDFDVFFKFNSKIIEFLQDAVDWIKPWLKTYFYGGIVGLINEIVDEMNKKLTHDEVPYEHIDKNTLCDYRNSRGEGIEGILVEKAVRPYGINIYGKRMN